MPHRPFKKKRSRPDRTKKVRYHDTPEPIHDDKIRTMAGVPVSKLYVEKPKTTNSNNTRGQKKRSNTLRKHQKKV